MASPEYQRLTRARSNGMLAVAVVSRTSLWLGADHLLVVNTNGYTETYKRFYFRDIQAFILQRTAEATIMNIVLAIPFVLLVVAALVAQGTEMKIFLFALAGLLAVLALINVLRGRTCRCCLRTAVQLERLPPLNRVRRAQKVFSQLRPLIAAAQGGELSTQMIADQMRGPDQPIAAATDVANHSEIPPRLDS
jgi:hypothetical protein